MTDEDISRLSEVVHDAVHELTGECRAYLVIVDCPEQRCFRVAGNVGDEAAVLLLQIAARKIEAQTEIPMPQGAEVTH